jgi:hypothetical protein
MLQRPHYISADISRPEIRYPWDEWDVSSAYKPADPELLVRLSQLTHRAQVGLTIATTEWITWRFETLANEPLPDEYLEGAWAGNVDLSYVRYIETIDDEWRGPIRGPLNVALMIVIDSLYLAEQSANTAENPCWAYNLASLVLPRTTEFQMWHTAVVTRLETYYKAVPEDARPLFSDQDYSFDPPVSRETFDPAHAFAYDMVPSEVDRYLRSLDYEHNRFLRTPEELSRMGFEGQAYRFPPELRPPA